MQFQNWQVNAGVENVERIYREHLMTQLMDGHQPVGFTLWRNYLVTTSEFVNVVTNVSTTMFYPELEIIPLIKFSKRLKMQ